jgi:hypothetical protein
MLRESLGLTALDASILVYVGTGWIDWVEAGVLSNGMIKAQPRVL